MSNLRVSALRRRLRNAAGVVVAVSAVGPAFAFERPIVSEESSSFAAQRPISSEDSPSIIIRNDINPNALPPAGNLDSGVNGVGQMIVLNQVAGSLSLCTGTLINPRTVIFAAHCVNSRPASAYGATTGNSPNSGAFGTYAGLPISFGFEATNRCLGVASNGCASGTGPYEAWRDNGFTTQADKHIFNVNQVWYDMRSLLPASISGGVGFLMGDVAIATLDTPATGVPTWAMLFSPLDGPANALQIGYGNRGNANSATIAIDYRRRAAENIISLLGSLDDRNQWLFGSASAAKGNLYMLSFSDPDPNYNTSIGKYDFGVFGGPSRGDAAREREGTTAGGDSGGPLIVEDKYDRQVIVGVLSGGSRFFAAQAGHNYGTHSFYQPLHAYWEAIVANNPYVYASANAGSRDWMNPLHWVQDMDPNYMIDVGGLLVNSLPNTPEEGVTGSGAKFGYICFLDECTELDQDAATSAGSYIVVPGGPGSTNFVPNNVDPNAALGIKARYFDVALVAPGTTTLRSSVTVDQMALAGPDAHLLINQAGTLNTVVDYTQYFGTTTVNGRINTNDMTIFSGLLAGSGRINAGFLTVVGGAVAPGGIGGLGTLTVDANMILASGSNLLIDLSSTGSDRLVVGGHLDLGGWLILQPATGRTRDGGIRHNQSFTIATAGQVWGSFDNVVGNIGLLRPELTYGYDHVLVTMRAGSFVTVLSQPTVNATPTALAFGRALDQMRDTSYTQLDGLYSTIDLMDVASIAHTLDGLAPKIATENRSLQSRQSKVMLNNITDRLATLGTAPTGTLSVNGSSAMLSAMATGYAPSGLGLQGMVPTGHAVRSLPEGMTGFVASGFTSGGSTIGENRAGMHGGQRSWYVGMGLEMEVMPELTIGTAFGYATGFAAPGGTDGRTESQMTQAAFYGAYQLGGGAYVAGLASAEMGRTTMQRYASTGVAAFDLFGATDTQRFHLMAEAGVALDAGRGLTVTPRAQMGWSSYQMGGFRETGGVTALQLDDLRLQRLEGRVGARVAGSANIAGWTLEPHVTADMVSTLSGANAGMSVRFANAGNHAFMLPIAGGDRAWGEVRGGLKATSGRLSFGAGIESSIGRSDLRDDRAVADFTLRF
jgi:subtilase-type serine protease